MTADAGINFKAVFASVPTPLMVMDTAFVIVDANNAYCEAVSRSRADFLGRNVFDAFPSSGDQREVLEVALRHVRDGADVDVLPVIGYPIMIDGTIQERYWSATHSSLRAPDGSVAFILQHTQDITELHLARDGAARIPADQALDAAVIRRAERIQALNVTLLEESAHLRNLFMQAPSFMCVLRGPDLRFELVNTAFLALVGEREILGRPIRQAIPEGVGQPYIDLLETVFRSGEPFVGKQMRAEFQRVPEEPAAESYLNFVYQPIFGHRGEVVGIFVDGNDVTDHVKAEKSQALLVRELHHRVRNTLATVQGVMNSTARTAETIEDYQWAFSGRISSLARTHSLLTEEIQQFVSFPSLLRQEVGVYAEGDASRVFLDGPDVALPSQLAVPLGMTIHELTTNAFRHGALSAPRGRISVTWSVLPGEDKRVLVCHWVETGGPAVSPPARQGFGSMILSRVLTQQIGAKIDTRYSPDGFELRAEIPLDIERV